MRRLFRSPQEPWRKTLAIMWAAQFIAMLGMSLVVPFLPFYIRHLGVTDEASVAQWSGLVFSGPFLPAFFLTPVWGYLGDRYGRKIMTVRAIFGLGLAQVLIGLATSVEMLFFFRMVQGAISGFLAAAMALVSVNTPRHRSGYAIGLLQTATSAGNVLGPFLGGTLADMMGYRPVFFLVAGLCCVTGLIIMFFVHDQSTPESSPSHQPSLRSNYGYVLQHRPIAIALGLIVISQMSVFLVQPIFALYVDSMIVGTERVATAAGAIFSVAGFFTVISAPWWGHRNDSKSTKKNLTLAYLGAAVAYGLHAAVTSLAPLVVLRALLGFCLGGMLPALYTYISKLAPASRRGGVLGIATSGNTLANFIAAPIGGLIGAQLGLRSVFVFAFGMLLVSVWFVRRYLEDGPPAGTDERAPSPFHSPTNHHPDRPRYE